MKKTKTKKSFGASSLIVWVYGGWRIAKGETFFSRVCLPQSSISDISSVFWFLFVALFFSLLKSLRSVTHPSSNLQYFVYCHFWVLLQMMHHTKINAKSEREKLSKWIKLYFVTVFSFQFSVFRLQHYNARCT